MDVSTAAAASSPFELDEPICPYTGLRTFTEAEAIYFRGRESHIARCLALLVAQRFVMITGASGDGKSSLVFAGMLPEVRAGFVPARHSRWAVATFRPERRPLHNLAQALTAALRLPSPEATATELSQGFSALVALYQASELCQPALPPGNLTPAQHQQQRRAANLLLVVDQFEEFFTNSENYDGDQPNTAAQTTVNLLLETARLAQAQDLPIYIVCTMRSDFVGQCAEFRGLIEQVGASQYFVPRLLRPEFQEVIKGPAKLSGNRISERLVQRLLYDIGQGQDQLPVLQHALRRIWLAADHGREEMDLLHYAMVGGLADALPPEDQTRFAAWRAALPAHQQQFLLGRPALRNVLDAHANQLYFEASDRYNRDFQPPLPPGTAERVLEQTFRVLTRTDGKRVVRNRVTGAQLTAILGDAALPWPVVCRILRPFREEGTTFLAPFLGEGDDGRAVLPPEAVLDISHESLIRNWGKLAEWAQLEAQDVRTANDFKQQAGRWRESGESKGYLLPIGLYNFFSGWHANKKGAAGWLAYYQSTNPDASLGQGPVATQVGLLARYLAASRRHLWSELLAARYGVWRLVAAILLPLVLLAGGWWWWAQRQVQSDYVADTFLQRGAKALLNPKLPVADKARFLISADRLKDHRPWFSLRPASYYAFPQLLNTLQDDTLALAIELSMYASVDNRHNEWVARENPYIQPILNDLAQRLTKASASPAGGGPAPLSKTRRRVAVLTARTVMALSYYLACDTLHRAGIRPDSLAHQQVRRTYREQRKQLLARLRAYVKQEMETTTGAAPAPAGLGFCLRVLLGQGTYSGEELAFLAQIDPFNPQTARQFNRLFSEEYYNRDSYDNKYLIAAIAFAALRKPTRTAAITHCLNQLAGLHKDFLHLGGGGTALLPYLVKYEVLTPANTPGLLAKCAQADDRSFNEVYTTLASSLLTIMPFQAVFDNGQAYANVVLATLQDRASAPAPEYDNADCVSFSLPVRARDRAWTALQSATPELARQNSIFVASAGRGLPAAAQARRNELFLRAFSYKLHGVYLHEMKQQPDTAAQAFRQFSRSVEELRHNLLQNSSKGGSAAQVSTSQWSLAHRMALPGESAPSDSVAQDPITLLQLPTRPQNPSFQAYYTCGFDAFFLYELQQAEAGGKLAQLLDSVALNEGLQPHPNLIWVSAIAERRPQAAGTSQPTAKLLLALEKAMRSPKKVPDSTSAGRMARRFLTSARQSDSLTSYDNDFVNPVTTALQELPVKLARDGYVAEAFALADSLSYMDPVYEDALKIRISEQAMLANNRSAQRLVDAFLLDYLRRNQAGEVSVNDAKAPLVAPNILTICFWRPDAAAGDSIPALARSLVYRLNAQRLVASLFAPFKAYGLADQLYKGSQEVLESPFRSSKTLFDDVNYLLLGYAHFETTAPNDGWREYDEAALAMPADYLGPFDDSYHQTDS